MKAATGALTAEAAMPSATDDGYVTLTVMSRMLGVAEPSLRRYADHFSGWLKSRVSAGRRRYFPLDAGKVFALIHDFHTRGMGSGEIKEQLTELLGPASRGYRGDASAPPRPAAPVQAVPARPAGQVDLVTLRQDSMEARLQEMQRVSDALTRAVLDLGKRVASLENRPARTADGGDAARAMAMAATSGN